jgi:hypothetical protein
MSSKNNLNNNTNNTNNSDTSDTEIDSLSSVSSDSDSDLDCSDLNFKDLHKNQKNNNMRMPFLKNDENNKYYTFRNQSSSDEEIDNEDTNLNQNSQINQPSDILNKYGLTEDFDMILKSSFKYVYQSAITLEKKISSNLFHFIINNYLLDKFNTTSLNLYAPLENVTLLGTKTDWSVICSRSDLTSSFIKKYATKFDIRNLQPQYYFQYDIMYENLKNSNCHFDHLDMIRKIVRSNKYTYDELLNLTKIVLNKKQSGHNNEDDIKEIYEYYVKNYYKTSSTDNLFKLQKFVNIVNHKINIKNYFSKYMTNYLFHKLSIYDWNYLIEDNLIKYYTGNFQISKELFELFYNNRNKLITSDVNPLIMKGYNIYQLEELIKSSINSGVDHDSVWNYVSYMVLDLSTPHWFWKKYEDSIFWSFTTEKIINELDEEDPIMTEIFIQWMKDNENMIESEFIDDIPYNLIIPEIMIAYFVNSKKINLHSILKLQRFSTDLLNYVVENVIMNSNITVEKEKLIFDTISSFQIMTPEFIEKYDKMLNWNLLKFNQTWTLFPHTSFTKLPVMDSSNIFMWGSIDDKINELNKRGFTAKKEGEYVIFNNLEVSKLSTTHVNILMGYHHEDRDNYYDDLIQKNYNTLYYQNQYKVKNLNSAWKIRNPDFRSCIIDKKKYNRVVFCFNPDLMDNNYYLYGNFNQNYNTKHISYVPMTFCYHNYVFSNTAKVHYKNLLIYNLGNNNIRGKNLGLYFPLDEYIEKNKF